jgi:putative transcriptional regulator
LLVASPPLVDPNFDRTVVLMLEHGDDGGLGVVLNRRSETTVADVFPEWHELVSPPEFVFAGGPVSTDAVIALARRRDTELEGFVQILDDLGTVDLAEDPLRIGASLVTLRVFAGYAGWTPGQLEAELEQGAWFVVAMEPDDPFVGAPERLWRDVLRRQRGRLALFSNYPEDATVN